VPPFARRALRRSTLVVEVALDPAPELPLHVRGERIDRVPHLEIVDVPPDFRAVEIDLARCTCGTLDPRIPVLRQDGMSANRARTDVAVQAADLPPRVTLDGRGDRASRGDVDVHRNRLLNPRRRL
jgi:hypothetical protein